MKAERLSDEQIRLEMLRRWDEWKERGYPQAFPPAALIQTIMQDYKDAFAPEDFDYGKADISSY